MTIRTILTRGYGAGASIPAVILRGYFPEPSTGDTHDGGGYYPSRRELDEIRRRLKQSEAAREKSFEEQRATERRLEQALQRAFRQANGEPEPEAVDIIAAVAPEATQPPVQTQLGEEPPQYPTLDFGLLAANLDAVTRLIAEFERRMQVEEDDIAILILAAA